jgi:hypothetical protein
MVSADADAALDTASKESAATTASQVAGWAATYAEQGKVPESYKQLEAENAAKAVAAFEDAKKEEAVVRAYVERLKADIRKKEGFQPALLTAISLFCKDERFVRNANKLLTLLVRPSVPSWAASGGGAASGGAGRPRNARKTRRH